MKHVIRLFVLGLLAFTVACDREGPVAIDDGTKGAPFAAAKGTGDPYVLKKMEGANRKLAARRLNLAVESIEFFTIGKGRPSNRIHQQEFRWVPNDPRREAQGNDITYLVDESDGGTASGLSSAQTTAAIDRGLATWAANDALKKVEIVRRDDPGQDPDIFDSFFGFGDLGNFLFADIVNAGWLPREFFEAVGGQGGGRGILAFSV